MPASGLLQPLRALPAPRKTFLVGGPAAGAQVLVTHNAAVVLVDGGRRVAVYRQIRGGTFRFREVWPVVGQIATDPGEA